MAGRADEVDKTRPKSAYHLGGLEIRHEFSDSEAKYRALLEAAPDAMLVVNELGEIVLLNAQVERRFGYHRTELIGQKVKNIIPHGLSERLTIGSSQAEVDEFGRIPSGAFRVELHGRRKDGSEFPIEIVLSRPLQSAEGTLVTAAIRDITTRRATEKQLAQMEARYRGLLEGAPDAIVVVNQAGEIVLLNAQAEKRFGYSRDQLVGRKVSEIIPEGIVAEELDDTEQSRTPSAALRVELHGRRKDGSEFPVEIVLTRPVESAEGILVTAAIRDITLRKQAEADLLRKVAELRRSNEELERFAYIASHDLQEPLRMVASFTQLLARRYKGKLDSDADEFIAFAVDGATRMQRLIHDLLAYSRVGTTGKELGAVSTEVVLDQALRNLRGAIDESGAVVTHDPLPAVLADEVQLIQLFQNLIGNAIKYHRVGIPQVHVSASAGADKKWVFAVRDNGIGIDAKYFERIFGVFQRLHTPAQFAGTGIGLAICAKIVERHGSTISVESQLGRGSTFRFALAEQ